MAQERRSRPLLAWLTAAALAAYSIALIRYELRTSQTDVRLYFADIEGPVTFFAVNTTLNVMLLFGAALLLFFTAIEARRAPLRQRLLMATQGLFCSWAAADDRFMFHEAISVALAIGDGWLMASVGVANAAAYLLLFRPAYITSKMALTLVGAALFFNIMLFVDTSVPQHWPLRLSIEDLCKTWSSFLLLLFAWQALRFVALKGSPASEALVVPASFRNLVPASWQGEHGSHTVRFAAEG
jgi:hypothetical protein